MSTMGKLMGLELMARLFGSSWIIAAVPTLYFFVSGIFFQGRWQNFFWALALTVVSKWLASVFRDKQSRALYEASLAEQGYAARTFNQSFPTPAAPSRRSRRVPPRVGRRSSRPA